MRLWGLAVVVTWGLVGLAQLDLEQLDRVRFLDVQASQLTVLVRAESDGMVEEAELKLAFKDIQGEGYVRIEFLQPAELAGQVFLITPRGTFFWQPELATPLRTSGAQAAFGDAAVAQIAGVRLARDYRITARRETETAEGQPQVELEVRAINPGVAFQTVVVLVDPRTNRPVELRLLAVTGVVLYRVRFTAYADFNGDVYVREQVVENALIEGNRTFLFIREVGFVPVPDEAFDPDRLGKPRS